MIISSSPCLPKKTFHCGNAISSIIADLIFRIQKNIYQNNECILIASPWNLHGLPYENMYKECYGKEGSYDQIKEFALSHVLDAEDQVSLFLDKQVITKHIDTDSLFVEFTKECFIKLIERGAIVSHEHEWFLNTAMLLKKYCLESTIEALHCYPKYHVKTILNEQNTFNSYYPLSKNRVFTPVVYYHGETICLNPIFQSFILPEYCGKRFCENSLTYQVAGSGFSTLKWQYFKILIGMELKQQLPIDNLVLHGMLLGKDGKTMSKHMDNSVQPRDLCKIKSDRNFVRYVLIRSISNNNIPLQLEKAKTEYSRLLRWMNRIQFDGLKPVKCSTQAILEESFINLKRFNFSQALENYYTYFKQTEFLPSGDEQLKKKLDILTNIFFLK